MSEVKSDAGSPPRRPYHSPKRAQAALERRRRMRVGVRGGEGDEPLTRRAPWTEMLAAATVPEAVARFAGAGAALMSRAARVLWLGEANANGDPQLQEARTRAHTDECGWTPDEYAELIEKLVTKLLLAPGSGSPNPYG